MTSPGLCTRPTTLTDHAVRRRRAARAAGVGLADETISTGGSFADATGGVLSRTSVNTRHQNRDDTDDRQRDDTGPARVGPHGRHPADAVHSDQCRAATGTASVSAWPLPSLVGIGLAVGTETALQPLGGQFGSHAVKARPAVRPSGPAR